VFVARAASDVVASRSLRFITDCSLVRCDDISLLQKPVTYVNLALSHQSCIDYILTSADRNVSKFEVLDPDINFSDHLPLMAIISRANLDRSDLLGDRVSNPEITASKPTQLRWDHVNINSYYHYIGCHLIPISDELDNVLSWFEFIDDAACDIHSYIDSVYCSIVSVLNSAAKL